MGIIISFTFACEDDLPSGSTNYVSFGSTPYSFKVEKDATSTKDFKVYAGNVKGSDRTYSVVVNESSTLGAAYYTVPSTVTIPANTNEGTLSISITDDDNLGFVNKTLILDFVDEAGINFGDALTINAAELCLDTIAKLKLDFDGYAEEAYWEIYDLSGTPTVIFSGGDNGEYDGNDDSTLAFEFCLASGNYGVVVYDNYGDGGTDFEVTVNGEVLATGSTPNAGGGYPVITQSSETFTID